jgi:hypothetical protein
MKQFCVGIIFAIGLTLPAFGQEVFKPEGTYQLNFAKSAIHGPFAIKSQTLNYAQDTVTVTGFDLNDKPFTVVFPRSFDGTPHPITGSPAYDTQSDTQINPYTVRLNRTKGGKLVQTGIAINNPTTNTMTLALAAADGSSSYVLVYEKQ